MWTKRPWSICKECEHSEKDQPICSKGLDIDTSMESCRFYKTSREKYYSYNTSQECFVRMRAESEKEYKQFFYLNMDELFDEKYKRYERRKIEFTFNLECVEEYLIERFGKPRIQLKVKYDFRELKLISIDAYADGVKFDCPFHEKDIESIGYKCYYIGKRIGCVRESLIGIGFRKVFGLCCECEYSNVWPENYFSGEDDECAVICSQGWKGDNYKYTCQNYKRSRKKYYFYVNIKDDCTEERLKAEDKYDEIFELQFRELFEVDHKIHDNGQIDIEFTLESAEEFLMKRFGKPRIHLKVRYDCNNERIIQLDAYADGEKFDCPFHEEDLSVISDECCNVGINIGYIKEPEKDEIYVSYRRAYT